MMHNLTAAAAIMIFSYFQGSPFLHLSWLRLQSMQGTVQTFSQTAVYRAVQIPVILAPAVKTPAERLDTPAKTMLQSYSF
jgi:hypothetical protein